MTYKRLKGAIKVLLIGDNELPQDNDMLLAAIEMAYLELASQATALKLLTVQTASEIIRQGPGGTYLRMPDLPEDDVDELDIDRELAPALARIIASYLSKDKSQFHTVEAKKILMSYESKVRVFLENQEAAGLLEETQDANVSTSQGTTVIDSLNADSLYE